MNNQEKFLDAIKRGDLNAVQYLITLPDVNPTAQDNVAIRTASSIGHLDIVKFLSTLPGVDPTAKNNAAFRWAAYNDNLDVIEFLLTLPSVDPTADNNSAIQYTSYTGNLNVVEILLADGRANPNAVTMANCDIPIREVLEQEISVRNAVANQTLSRTSVNILQAIYDSVPDPVVAAGIFLANYYSYNPRINNELAHLVYRYVGIA